MGVVPKKNSLEKIVLLYASASTLWIILSDFVVTAWIDTSLPTSILHSVKGIAFVLVTSAILYGILRWLYRREDAIHLAYKKILHDPSQFFWLSDKDGTGLHLSHGFEVITGASLDVFAERPWPQFIHPADREKFLQERERAVKLGAGYEATFRLKSRGGDYIQVQVREVPVKNPETGSVESWVGNATDITEIHHARRELEQKNTHFRLAESIGGVSLWSWDFATDEIHLSETLASQLGFSKTVVTGGIGKFVRFIHRENRQKLINQVRIVAQGGEPTSENLYRVRYGDGSFHWFITRLSAIKDDDDCVVGVTGVNIDITQQKEQQDRLRYVAIHDDVTGLYNRPHMVSLIQQAIDNGGDEFGILLLDIDRFGSINSFFGLDFGNALLAEVARALQTNLGSDGELARLASDDFVIFIQLQQSGREAMAQLAHRLHDVLREPVTVNGKTLYLTFSLGSTIYPEDGQSVEILFRNAEAALKHAREAGGDHYVPYSSDIARKEEESASFVSALRYGIEHGEFYIEVQPQYDVEQQQYVAAEVLARWESATLGRVPPSAFIPVAEKLGLVTQICELLFRDALALLSRIHGATNPGFRLSLNIETSQLYESGFAKWLNELLLEFNMAHRFVELEITESVLMSNTEQGASVLRGLKQDGFRVAIDDFGTGHSSLGYLGILQADTIKIDKSFIRELTNDDTQAMVTETMVMLAKNLSLEVVAEGVETRQQLEAVSKLGCRLIQGYYFSKPVSGDQLIALLQGQQATSPVTST